MASSSAWTYIDWNKALNKYNADRVKMSRDETKTAVEVVIPIVQDILKEVNKQDSRFDCQPLHAGSYSQGLKVARADEFDVNVKLCGIGGMSWNDLSSGASRNYEFSDGPMSEDPVATFPEHRKIVLPARSAWQWFTPVQKSPPDGYCFVSLQRSNPAWEQKDDMVFDNDIIPYMVKKRFKDLLADAITKLNLRDRGVRRGKPHGPAQTVGISAPGLPMDHIDIDFAPIIEAALPLPSWINWPRRNSSWPSQYKMERIKSIGINLVAKKNFYWMLSFGKMEKELVDGMDEGGGCRKQVHRLTKKMLSDIWCPTTKPVISSYHLKNALFWECEENPSSMSWQIGNLGERFQGVVDRLRDAIRKRHLPLYFHPDVNLFQEKNAGDLDDVGKKIDKFKSNPAKYLTV